MGLGSWNKSLLIFPINPIFIFIRESRRGWKWLTWILVRLGILTGVSKWIQTMTYYHLTTTTQFVFTDTFTSHLIVLIRTSYTNGIVAWSNCVYYIDIYLIHRRWIIIYTQQSQMEQWKTFCFHPIGVTYHMGLGTVSFFLKIKLPF